MSSWIWYYKSTADNKGWFGNIFGRTPKPDQPHQDLHGKPCGVGQNTARDGCIANEGTVQAGNNKPNNAPVAKPNSSNAQQIPKPSKEDVLGTKPKHKKAKVELKNKNDQPTKELDKSEKLFWDKTVPGLTPETIGALSGIDINSDKVSVSVTTYKNFISLDAIDAENEISVQKIIYPNGMVQNEYIEIGKNKRGQGLGSRLFVNEVSNAIKAGLKVITGTAERGEGFNGYYTWPRLGYDANVDEMDDEIQNKIHSEFPEAKTIQDLYKTKEGRDWWKANGSAIGVAFDLSDGSESRQILAAYIKERNNKNKKLTPIGTNRSRDASSDVAWEIDLNEDEESALDAVWEKRDKLASGWKRYTKRLK